MTVVQVRGAELDVSESGSGAAFVWAHGLTSSRANEDERLLFDWSGLAATRRLIRFDARGHGRSPATALPADHSWPELALDLLALADELGLHRFAAGGASMGAATLLHAAVIAPERIERMVLVIPPTAWATRAGQRDLYEGAAHVIETKGLEAYLAMVAERPVPAVFAEDPELARARPDIAEASMPTVLRGAAMSDLPEAGALRTLEQPTLVLAWAGDPGHPVSTAERLVELLPQARLEVAATLDGVRSWPAAVERFVTQS